MAPRNAGFTLVELVMALAFFSFMMAILSIGVLQIMEIYQAGVSSRRTQQAARVAMEDITREVRAASRVEVDGPDHLCLEGARPVDYQRINDELIKKVGGANCNDLSAATTTTLIGTSEANNNLKLRQFDTNLIVSGSDDSSVDISLLVTTGADELLSGDGCIPGETGSQYCATTQFSSTVSLRGASG